MCDLAFIAQKNSILAAGIGGTITSLFNLAGAIPVLFRIESRKVLDAFMGFAAGVMIAASFTSLIIPGTEMENGLILTIFGIVMGGVLIYGMDKLLPHMHILENMDYHGSRLKTAWLFLFAITIHNLPEGLAVGVGFGSGNYNDAFVLMMAIGLQNIPEGFSVGAGLVASRHYSRKKSLLLSISSGFVELPMAVIGAVIVSLSKTILPFAMGLAGGAMLYVVSNEIIPESHSGGHEDAATAGLMAGLIVMLTLDVALG